LIILSNFCLLASNASRSSINAGSNEELSSITAATCMAVGKLSQNQFSYKEYSIDLRIVAALAHVNMIIRVNRFLRAKFTAEELDSTV
jgi:hypothetical protein